MKLRFAAVARYTWVMALLVGSATFALAQTTISGTITDAETDEPLIGANILIVGTSTGTVTDYNGDFQLLVPAEAEQLRISYTGYATQTIPVVAGQTTYNLELGAGELLEEVVVIGYGSETQSEVTSAVTSVKEEDFNQGVVNNPTQLVQGKVAGLQIAQPGGDPNANPTIRLRGLSTLGANTEPLIIIDGVIGASLNTVDPSDIASIDVLKDGSAAAIYGTRAGSGVIIVTTKQGRAGDASINYRVQGGVENLARGIQIASAEEFISIRGFDTDGNLIDADSDGIADVDFGARNDYVDQLTRTAFSQVHNLSFTGGAGNGGYRASINYRDVEGVAINTGFEQLNGRLNVNQSALDDLVKFDLTASLTSRDADYSFTEAFRYAAIFNPTLPVRVNEPDGPSDNGYQVLGGYTQIDQFDYINPIALVEQNSNVGVIRDALISGRVTVSPVNNLNFSAQYAVTTKNERFDIFNSRFSRGGDGQVSGVDRGGLSRRTNNDSRDNLFELTGDYTLELDNDVEIDFLAGYSYQQFNRDNNYTETGDFITDIGGVNTNQFSRDITEGRSIISSGGDRAELESFFGRVGLDFANTYFLKASIRTDGSSRFGVDEKRGIFPAVSGGINLGSFVTNPAVNTLKLRVGYGVTGNLPASSLGSQTRYTVERAYPISGDASQFRPGARIVETANSGLRFEKKSELNVGFDLAFFDYRLTGSVDYFRRNTDDLLFRATVPVGGSSPNGDIFFTDNVLANLDDVVFRNEGVELALGYEVLNTANFSYSPRIIVSTVKTTLDSVDADNPVYEFFPGQGSVQFQDATSPGAPGQNNAPTQIIRAGEEIGQIYTYVYSGVGDDGDYVFQDLNGDGTIDFSSGESPDKMVVGNGLPDWTLGFANEFRFGNWNANLFFRGAFGHSLANMPRNFYENTAPTRGTDNIVMTDLFNPELRPQELRFNSLYVEKADFVTLDNASIGYTFPMSAGSRLNSVRVALSGQRLFYITNYTGVDPEVRYADNRNPLEPNVLAPGIDRRNNYFRTRSFNLALNVGF